MKTTMPRSPFAATRYDGRSPVGEPVTMLWSGATVKVIGTSITQNYVLDRLSVSPRIGKADRFVALPDGSQLQCVDVPLLDRVRQEGRAEGVAAWLEQRWHVAIAVLAITLATLAAGYVYGLPALANQIAARVPIEYERDFGVKVVGWLDE